MSEAHLSATAALIAHLESAADDQRVLLVGRADTQLPAQILSRGARLVHVLDGDTRRVADAAARNKNPRISFAQLTDSALRDGSYGLALVENLAELSQPRSVCEKIAKTIRPSGVVAIATRADSSSEGLLGNDGAHLSYQELRDWCEENFEATRTLGQSAFVGYSVVHFDLENPPEPSLDNGYIQAEDAAEYYLAICGTTEALSSLELEDMTIVQLEAAQVLAQRSAADAHRANKDRRQILELQSELETRSSGRDADSEKLRADLEARDESIFELKKELARARSRADDAEAELDRIEEELSHAVEGFESPHDQSELLLRVEEAERQAKRAKKEAKWAEERVRKLEKELEQVLREAEERWSDEGGASDAEFEELQEALDKEKDETQRLRASLEERGAASQELRKENQSLSAELEQLKAELQSAHESASLAREESERSLAQAQAIEKRNKRNSVDVEKSQARLKEEQAALQDARQDVRELSAQLQSLSQKLHDAEDDADHFYALAKQRKVKIDSLSARLEKSEKRDNGSSGATAVPGEVLALEAQLKERAEKVAKLERDLSKLQSYAQGLVAELKLAEEARGSSERQRPSEARSDAKAGSEAARAATEERDSQIQAQLEALSDQLAEKEADLVAARWTIGQLKSEVVNP